MLKIGRSSATGTDVQSFEGDTFESALRLAAHAGVLKSVCLEKQIAFLVKTLPENTPPATVTSVPADLPPYRVSTHEYLFPSMTAAISALVHEIQVERGMSSVFLSSEGKLFARELRGQWRVTDERRADFLLFRRRHGRELPALFATDLERAEGLLAGVGAARTDVEAVNATVAQVIERYSRVTADLLSVVDGLATKGVEDASRSSALAWMALLHAKEKTGQERAQLAAAFAQDRYAEGQHATVSALIAACQSYLHVFTAGAPRPAGDLLRQKLQSDVGTAVVEMERVALLKREGGFGIDPRAWFSTISRKMDFLADVESTVRASLTPGL